MALWECPECGKKISEHLDSCPFCKATGLRERIPAHRKGAGVARRAVFWIAIGAVLWVGYLQSTGQIGSGAYSAGSSSSRAADKERERRQEADRRAAARAPVLQLLSFRCEEEYGYMRAVGQVKNISSESIKNVAAVGTFYTESGEFIKADRALIEYNPILPGQTSPFDVGTTANPAFSRCEVDFKDLLGGSLRWTR